MRTSSPSHSVCFTSVRSTVCLVRSSCSWDYFPATNACPFKEKLGMTKGFGDSGKWVCGVGTLLQKKPCVVYSFG